MQNPFRNRNENDFARSNPDDDRYETRDRSFDEGRSWNGGDGGRTASRYGGGQYARDDQSRGSFDQYDYGSQPTRGDWGRDRQDYRSSSWDRDRHDQGYGRNDRNPGSGYTSDYGRNAQFGQSSYDHRNDQGYGRSHRNYDADTNYADGSEIWRDHSPMDQRRASQRDYEPDYLHWRNEQVSKFDRDYDDWRSERRQKFSSDFDTWRQGRSENPIVGDVADGGVGSSKDVKKG